MKTLVEHPTAKRPDTRQCRITQGIARLERGEKLGTV